MNQAPSPIVFREIVPGFSVFDCLPLRASLSRSACADNYLVGRCMPCLNCPVGRRHANGARPKAAKRGLLDDDCLIGLRDALAKRCVRCGGQVTRLIARGLCPSCSNRQGEVLKGRNAKGAFPIVAAGNLRWVALLILADDTLERAFYPQGNPLGANGLPVFEVIDSGSWLVRAVATGADELRRSLERVADFTVLDSEVGPTFLEQREVFML